VTTAHLEMTSHLVMRLFDVRNDVTVSDDVSYYVAVSGDVNNDVSSYATVSGDVSNNFTVNDDVTVNLVFLCKPVHVVFRWKNILLL
jgi:hypothetical protein